MSIHRNQRTIYCKSRIASGMMFSKQVFGSINSFTIVFDIPIAELSVQMEIRGGCGQWVGGIEVDTVNSGLRITSGCGQTSIVGMARLALWVWPGGASFRLTGGCGQLGYVSDHVTL